MNARLRNAKLFLTAKPGPARNAPTGALRNPALIPPRNPPAMPPCIPIPPCMPIPPRIPADTGLGSTVMHSAAVATSVMIVLRLMFSSLDMDAHPSRDWRAAFPSLVRRGLFAAFSVPIVVSDRLVDADDRVLRIRTPRSLLLNDKHCGLHSHPFTCNSYARDVLRATYKWVSL